MNPRMVDRVARWIRDQLRVPFVVVGGSAIEHRYEVGSKDVDLLIGVGDWDPLDRALEGRRDATPLEPTGGTIRGTEVTLGGSRVEVEFISGQPFCGNLTPDDFVRYVRVHRSTKAGGVAYADPSVVFYMRLGPGILDWEANVYSIQRDLTAGVPLQTLDGAVAVGRHFGVGDVISERVRWTREKLKLFSPPRATVDPRLDS